MEVERRITLMKHSSCLLALIRGHAGIVYHLCQNITLSRRENHFQAVPTDSDILSRVTRWTNGQLDWLKAKRMNFTQWADAIIANPDVNEYIRELFISLREWAVSVIDELTEKFAAIKQRAANPSVEELQQLKDDIWEIKEKIIRTLEIVNERSSEIYAHIEKNKSNSTSGCDEEVLVSIDAALRKRVKNDLEWESRATGEVDDFASLFPGEKWGTRSFSRGPQRNRVKTNFLL